MLLSAVDHTRLLMIMLAQGLEQATVRRCCTAHKLLLLAVAVMIRGREEVQKQV